MIPVIISGGSGTRLWPVSRLQYPKQFSPLFGSCLQTQTIKRCLRLGSPWILTGEQLKNLTEINLKENGLGYDHIIYEPFGRNTAPAIALLCRVFELKGLSKEVVGVFPSDHLIRKEDEFLSSVRLAEKMALIGHVVTLGIHPLYPETGYGYIQTGPKSLVQEGSLKAMPVIRFHEKPNFEKAQEFLSDGHYSWNAGIFVFQIEKMISHFEKHQPEIWSLLSQIDSDLKNLKSIYEQIKPISIDYAIMEKLASSELACIPCDIGWSDVGSWDAVADEFKKDGRSHIGGAAFEVDSSNNFSFLPSGKSVSLVGVKDLVIVDTEDTLLISKKGETQKLRNIVEQVEKKSPELTRSHKFEDRPWGHFQILKDTEKFKSKVIRVNAQSQLSYQSHTKREEHWIITSGQGEVVLNDQVIPVKVGSHIHIPLGAKHRIRNTHQEPLEFVEVQLGTYFGEDDIVRYQDDYKRV